MQTVYVVLDTNTFLHYISIEQIKWAELFPNQTVVLFICPTVLRELNKHKDAPRTVKLRERASAAIRKIDNWADAPVPITLREGVELRFRIYDSNIDFAAHNLVKEIADDHFIAAAIALKAECDMTSVVILTRDTGLKLKARALGFSVASLPDTDLLPEDIIPSDKRIKELEIQVKELQNARPKLRLAFPGGSNNRTLLFPRRVAHSQTWVPHS